MAGRFMREALDLKVLREVEQESEVLLRDVDLSVVDEAHQALEFHVAGVPEYDDGVLVLGNLLGKEI